MGILVVIEALATVWSGLRDRRARLRGDRRAEEEARGNMHAAPRMHLDGLREDGASLPEGRTSAEVVGVA